MRFFQIDHGFIREISTDNNTEHLPLIEQADWIDVREPSDEERKLLSKSLGIELPNSGDVGEIEASSRYFVDNEGLHVHSLFISPTEGRHRVPA